MANWQYADKTIQIAEIRFQINRLKRQLISKYGVGVVKWWANTHA